MIRLRPSGVDELLIKRVRDWYEPGPGVFITSMTGASFSPAMLFTGSTTGVWYDPSDFTTLFQDAAGTTPVTAVEQPVGLMKDKSGRNNHAFNSSGNSANFPVLSARYNLLTKTEDFGDWTLSSTSIASQSIAGFAKSLQFGDNSVLRVGYGFAAMSSGVSYTITAYVEMDDGLAPVVGTSTSTGDFALVSDASLHTASATVERIGTSNVYKVSSSRTSGTTGNRACGIYKYTTQSARTFRATGFDVRVSNDAINQPAYQRVNTSTDYDTVGFKPYLRFNGTNQWLQTNSIDFTYGDKMFVSAGVRYQNLAVTSVAAELSTSLSANNGTFIIYGENTSTANFASKGTSSSGFISSTSLSAPITIVQSGLGNISGNQAILRVNGAQAAISSASQGSGTYGNYPLYIGARAGSSLWFNGRIYQLVVAGKQASASEITSTETYLNQKTGAF